jgi:hypothetical protein
MNATHALILCLWATPGADLADRPATADPAVRARELVSELAHPRFKVREAAERELIALGSAAIAALKQGENDADPHVRERCKALQPMIRDLELRRKMEQFIAGQGDAKSIPMATWFLSVAGDTKASRALFAEVFSQNGLLFDTLAADRKKALEQFIAICQETAGPTHVVVINGVMQAPQRKLARSEVAAYLMFATELADKTGRASPYGYTYLRAPSLAEALSKDSADELPLKKLFLHWLEKEPQAYMVQQGLQVAVDAKMKEAMPLILKQVREKSAPIYTRAQTALLLAKVGAKEHLKDIEPLLEDKTVIGNFGINNKRGTVQLRDIALAVSVKLQGQKMADYDFDMMQGTEELIHMSYIYCAFTTDAKREAAHKKYKEFLAKDEKKKE